jgi:alanyl-tRNA synthetase
LVQLQRRDADKALDSVKSVKIGIKTIWIYIVCFLLGIGAFLLASWYQPAKEPPPPVVEIPFTVDELDILSLNELVTFVNESKMESPFKENIAQSISTLIDELKLCNTVRQRNAALDKAIDEILKNSKELNEKIAENLAVVTEETDIESAKKKGAMALFGEKYGETVRVVSMGDFSAELCGGTHVQNTGDIAFFKILSESGVAAGVRRIEALTGANVMAYYKAMEETFVSAVNAAKATPATLVDKIQNMQTEMKALASENESLKAKAAKDALGDVMNQVKEVKGVKLLATSVAGVDMNGLRDLGDSLKEKLGDGVVVLLSEQDGKVNMITMVTEGAMAKGAHAGNLIKGIAALVGGGGGGRPNMAQAGGKNPEGVAAALEKVLEVVEGQIK